MASGTEAVEGENSFLQVKPVEMVELLAKAFKDVPSGRLFAIVDKWLLKCSCDRKNNETEEFITTYTSGVREYIFCDQSLDVSIVEDYAENSTEQYFYVIFSVSFFTTIRFMQFDSLLNLISVQNLAFLFCTTFAVRV